MAIRYTGGGADFMPLGYQDENITVDDLTNNEDVGNFLISAANALPNQSGIINALPNIMSPGVRTIENQAMRNFEQPYNMRDVAGESLPFNIDNLGNPNNDPRVVSEELGITGFGRPTMADIAGMDLPQGMPSQYDQSAVDGYEDLIQNPLDNPNRLQNIERNIDIENEEFEEIPGFNFIDAPTSLGSRLQNLEYFNNPRTGFIDNNILARGNPNRGLNINRIAGPLTSGLGFVLNSNPLRALGLGLNIASGNVGRAKDAVSRGIGSIAGKMRGINPVTGKANTQAQYEQDRADRQAQTRTDNMIDRIAAGKKTRSNPRDAGTTKAQKNAISAAIQDSYRGGGGGESSSSPKIVCTMMNERYGFGSFRNKIWMKFHEHHGPEYQKGYHAIFLPLVKIAKGEGKINTAVRKVLEHMGRHVTADMFKIMKGKKRDTLGRIYRAIFEPACHIIGKIKSALGSR